MIFTTDVHYTDQAATAAGIIFPHWESDIIERVIIKEIDSAAPYEPGAFYKRELPCILALLSDIKMEFQVIVIDGYVTLGKDAKPGLGMHLYESINQAAPVIGVAKKMFVDTPDECQIYRGNSQKPLFVSSVGVPLNEAKSYIVNMHGRNRIPTILKKVDQLCRGINV